MTNRNGKIEVFKMKEILNQAQQNQEYQKLEREIEEIKYKSEFDKINKTKF